jgi:hypothetical protein
MTDPRPSHLHSPLPAPPQSGVKELDTAAELYASLVDRYKAARRRLQELTGGRQAAQRADLYAASDAIRAGKTDPGKISETKLDEDIGETVRAVDVLAVAAQDAADDLADLVGKHRAAMVARYEGDISKARAVLAKALETVQTAVDEVTQAHAGLIMARSWPKRVKQAPPRVVAEGHDIGVHSAVESLRNLFRPEAPSGDEWINARRVAAELGYGSIAAAKEPVAELVKAGRIMEHLRDAHNQPAPQCWYSAADVAKVKAEREVERFEKSRQRRLERRAEALTGPPAA